MRWPNAVILILAALAGLLIIGQTPQTITYVSEVEAQRTGRMDIRTMDVTAPLWFHATTETIREANRPFDRGDPGYRIVSQSPAWGTIAGRLGVLALVTLVVFALVSALSRGHARAPASEPR